MKLTDNDIKARLGKYGEYTPQLTANGNHINGGLGSTIGVSGTSYYVGLNHGEVLDKDIWQQIIAYIMPKPAIKVSDTKALKDE